MAPPGTGRASERPTPAFLILRARPSRRHPPGHLRVPLMRLVWFGHEKDPAHGTGSQRVRYLILNDAVQVSFTHFRIVVLSDAKEVVPLFAACE